MEVKGKFVVALDTICDGHQTSTGEDGMPVLYDSYNEAFKELFTDAICGLEGCEEPDEYAELVQLMNEALATDDVEKMQALMDKYPEANYYGEFIQKAEEFVLGRKTFFNGKGVVISGTKLKDLK